MKRITILILVFFLLSLPVLVISCSIEKPEVEEEEKKGPIVSYDIDDIRKFKDTESLLNPNLQIEEEKGEEEELRKEKEKPKVEVKQEVEPKKKETRVLKSYRAIASYYGAKFHGRTTANGEIYDKYKLTAAHKTLPFGTKVQVTHRGKSVVVRINDRGPFVKGREIDLSQAAAQKIGMINDGVAEVKIKILK